MPFLNIPIKAIQVNIGNIIGTEVMPWDNPSNYPIPPGFPVPPAEPREYRWTATLSVQTQTQSSIYSRAPGYYDGMDIEPGLWVANLNSGATWQIISVSSKTQSSVDVILQDINRYNTFADPGVSGNGSPPAGVYVVFALGEDGQPMIDPSPSILTSSQFYVNLQSRFQYINLQYDYPLFQKDNNFQINDVVAVNPADHTFVKADGSYKTLIGRVTSISDTIDGWFTINPVQKIVDYLDYLPGNIGDTVYSSTDDPGKLTTDNRGTPLYIKLRNNGQTRTASIANAQTSPGNAFQINGQTVEVTGAGQMGDIVADINNYSTSTGVVASVGLVDNVSTTNPSLLGPFGALLEATTSPAVATINGTAVTFNIRSKTGFTNYSYPEQMAQAINNANVPNIIATYDGTTSLSLINITGGSITIVNVSPDSNGTNFAGSGSGSGLVLFKAASSFNCIRLLADDARAINLLNVVGLPLQDLGLVSVDNAPKAAGLYIQAGIRQAKNTVVADLAALNDLNPLIGDTAYVIDSDDGNGNYVNQWSTWVYDGAIWILTGRQTSSVTAAQTIDTVITPVSADITLIGTVRTDTRVTTISVEVTQAFNGTPTLTLGYEIYNPSTSVINTTGLMPADLMDLSTPGIYVATSDILFGTDTITGDVLIHAYLTAGGATTGAARILVSYV